MRPPGTDLDSGAEQGTSIMAPLGRKTVGGIVIGDESDIEATAMMPSSAGFGVEPFHQAPAHVVGGAGMGVKVGRDRAGR